MDEPYQVSKAPVVMSPQARFSAIYPVEARHAGTGHIECLSSCICRISELHSLPTGILLRHVLGPAMKRWAWWMSGGRKRYESLYLINGYGELANLFVDTLGIVSKRQGWGSLTLLPLQPVFNQMGHGLLVPFYRRWCPLCLQEDVASGEQPYARLIWTLRAVTVCTRHQVPLQECCPHCGARPRVFPGLPVLDRCDHCGGDLKTVHKLKPLQESSRHQQFWFARGAEKLIERTCASSISLENDALRRRLAEYVTVHGNGDLVSFAKKIQFAPRQIRAWISGETRPSFLPFLDLCYRLDCPPDRFLLDQMELTSPDNWREIPRQTFVNRKKKKMTKQQREQIEKHLDRIIKQNPRHPPPVSKVAQSLGITFVHLSYLFPEKYKLLKQRNDAYRKRVAEKACAKRIKHVASKYQTLVSKGLYPSERRLKERGGVKPRYLRRPEVRNWLHNRT